MAKKELETSALLCSVMTALVSCQGNTGKPNIITVSWGGILRTYPPLVGISIQTIRHSHRLITESQEFVINIPSEDIVRALDICGWTSGKDEDKFEKTGLTPVPSRVVKPPAIKECPVNLECRVKETKRIEPYDFFISEVVATVADEEVILPGAENAEQITFKEVLDIAKCRPVTGVIGGGKYWNFKEGIKPFMFSKE